MVTPYKSHVQNELRKVGIDRESSIKYSKGLSINFNWEVYLVLLVFHHHLPTSVHTARPLVSALLVIE